MLCEHINVDYIIWENKPILEGISKDFELKEKTKFSKYLDYEFKCPQLNIEKGAVNSTSTINLIKSLNPDLIFVFGSSLLKPNVFNIAKVGCINIHTGLVQYFRGVDSSFWAIYNEQPQAIGATLHFINNTIDAGDIIDQRHAELSVEDDLDDLFLKSCKCGFDMLLDNLDKIKSNQITTMNLDKWGKLYTLKDMNEKVKKTTQNKLYKVLNKYLND
tara:strand:- start:153 stop:803 length:651 start_codon:yes stop_codon:yes gene_type:complete